MNYLHRYLNNLVISLCLLFSCGVATAATDCAVTIESNDQISWNKQAIEVDKQCSEFTITLVHAGKLDKEVMGHNWVLAKEQDMSAVAKGVWMQKATDYIKEDPRIIAHTQLIGGGEQSSIVVEVNKLQEGQKYVYFCSYPEHVELMHGTLELLEEKRE